MQDKTKRANKVKCMGCPGNYNGSCIVSECIRAKLKPEPEPVPA